MNLDDYMMILLVICGLVGIYANWIRVPDNSEFIKMIEADRIKRRVK